MFRKTNPPAGKIKPREHHSYLKFALTGNMITPDEHKAILDNKMEIIKGSWFDENSHGLVLANKKMAYNAKTTISLYHNRCDDILIARLLGEE